MSSWREASVSQKLDQWQLTALGGAFSTTSSHLQPVLRRGERAMLKVARLEEEANGCRLLAWWNGAGAARVFEHDESAVVLAWGGDSLVGMSSTGDDDRATSVLCDVAARLHDESRRRYDERPDGLIPLDVWFASLFARPDVDGIYARAAALARDLLSRTTDPADIVVLHGDLHHDNVLDFGALGWLAIDPKYLIGHRVFDYTNILCNPVQAIAEARFDRRVTLIADVAHIDEPTLLEWTIAWTGLSASWFAADGNSAAEQRALRIGALAGRRLAIG
jgi:streptomycin 6-kinase